MLHDLEMMYSKERGTWNLFVDGEWYAEGSQEYVERMWDNFMCADEEDI